jgi:PhnO protein
MNNPDSITIRPAISTDMPVIYRFIHELDNVYLVAVDENNTITGYLSCHGQFLLHHCGWVFEIQEMYVQEGARGKGIGKMLITELENKLSARNYVSLEVTANMKRTATHTFYISCGFTETHKKFTKNNIPS